MKCILIFGIFAFSYNLLIVAGGSVEVKFIDGKPLIRDREYINQIHHGWRQVNESYNALTCEFEVYKDFPLNTRVMIEIYRPNSQDNSAELLRQFTFDLGDKSSRHYKFLGNGPLAAMKGSNTIKKGYHKSEDFGHFQFHKFLTKEELKNPYLQMFYTLKSDYKVLLRNYMKFQLLPGSFPSPPKDSKRNPRVKFIEGKPLVRDVNYINNFKHQNRIINESYTELMSEFEVVQDFPLNTRVTVEIFRPNSQNDSSELLRQFTFDLGNKGSKYHKHLGKGPLAIMKGSNTVKKGHYKIDHFSHFQFHKFLTKEELQNPYLEMFYTLKSDEKVIFKNYMKFQSLSEQ